MFPGVSAPGLWRAIRTGDTGIGNALLEIMQSHEVTQERGLMQPSWTALVQTVATLW